MAVGENGRAVQTTVPGQGPTSAAPRIGKHFHKGSPESTVSAPGATQAPGASLSGSSGSSPYGRGGDQA